MAGRKVTRLEIYESDGGVYCVAFEERFPTLVEAHARLLEILCTVSIEESSKIGYPTSKGTE